MTQLKPPMSGSYKAIFAFSIFMVVFTFVAGAIGGPGRGAMGVFLWGYPVRRHINWNSI